MLCPRPSAQCHSVASPRSVVPLPCCAHASLLVSTPRLCTAVPCFSVSLLCTSFAYPLVSTQFRFRSNPSSALAVPVDATLRLCLQCFSDAGRGYANQCRCNSHRYISSLFLCRSMRRLCSSPRIESIADRRISAANQIVSSPGPFNSALRLCISIRNYTFLLRRLAARAFPQLSPW